jgi:predicted metal-dependent enzyme (double-stranded beta helix superfamily)
MDEDANPSFDLSRRRVLGAAAAIASGVMLPRPARAESAPPAASTEANPELQRFVADCIAANAEHDPQAAVLEVLSRAVRDPSAMLASLGEPVEAGIRVLHRSKSLTVFSATWTPQMNLMPHNHLMWANIGIYTGREDNILWRQGPDRIEAFGAKALFAGQATALQPDVIHSVTNPLQRYTGGIHIYGGDFFETTRSQWDPETLAQAPSDGATIRRIFELENERMRARQRSNKTVSE